MTRGWDRLGLGGVETHDRVRAAHRWARARWVVFAGCMAAIPAFYVELLAQSGRWMWCARALYACTALACAGALGVTAHVSRRPGRFLLRNRFDLAIAAGALLSMLGGQTPWSSIEWSLRLGCMCVIAVRLVVALRDWFAPNRLVLFPVAGMIVLLLAGVGFEWLEPNVHGYAEGLWLAFESGAAVGYGDIAPTTPASRVFAVFVVLLGYGLLSLVYAGIAALFIGREERALRQEMHRDIKALHDELAVLHLKLDALLSHGSSEAHRDTAGDVTARQAAAAHDR